MSIYQMYCESTYFRNIVDTYALKHRMLPKDALKCMEIKDAYEAHLNHLTSKARVGR